MNRPFTLHSPYHPSTFLERGVAVYCTTPALAGSRVRSNGRNGLELIVPNLSGGRGFYILPWSGMCDFCRPTLHDRRLQERVAALRAVAPITIRQIANEVAGAGYAGRAARAAAETSREQESQAQVVANFNLVLLLITQVERRYPEPHGTGCANVEQRAKRAITHAAPQLGLDSELVASSLEQLAALFKYIGLGPGAESACHPRAIGRLAALRNEMLHWSSTRAGDSATCADIVRRTADLTLSCASILLEEARRMTSQMLDLLANWNRNPDALGASVSRLEWLLDGWEPICSMWDAAERTESGRQSALLEMVQHVPILPKEVGEWVDEMVTYEAASLFRRYTELNRDWRTGLPYLDLIARNEQRRALMY